MTRRRAKLFEAKQRVTYAGSRRASAALVAVLLFCGGQVSAATDWRDERWTVEGFTNALSGGPEGGPVEQAGGGSRGLCEDDAGRLFLLGGQFIDIVTPTGLRMRLAGSGTVGYRDGPAKDAQFRFGEGAYYGVYNIACGPNGVFVSDGGNRRVRRIFSGEGGWRVSTWAGGGKSRMKPGETGRPLDAGFSGTITVAAAPSGELTVADSYGAYRVSADGTAITYLGPWPESTIAKPGKPPTLNVVMGDADSRGFVYFVSRTPDFVIRIHPTGKIEHLAGILFGRERPTWIGDGPPREVYFDTPSTVVARPDGSAVYVCGGDEYDIRRVPTDGQGTTATLMQNGRWYKASVHPNRSRGPALFRPNAEGRLKPDGELTDLMVTHLLGRDASGNLYGSLFPWVGMTQVVEGEGPLGTKIFRLRQVP